VRNARFEAYETVPRPVVTIGNSFPESHLIALHWHRHSQLVYSDQGVMMVGSDQGRWIVPPRRAVWIPSGVPHELRMMTAVDTITIWIDPDVTVGMPTACRVVEVPPLAHNLLHAVTEIPAEYDNGARDGALVRLLLLELRDLPELPLRLPFPSDPRLAARCHAFLRNPGISTIDDWSAELGMSRRSFTRLFRAQTGVSFSVWRQQACVLSALPKLASGEAITTIALDLGYESPAAFTTMFKRLQGVAPRQYVAHAGTGSARR
jgi:AraC-like DNA-binding protein